MQTLEKVPELSVLRITLPVGVALVPGDVSVTVAVHEPAWFTTTGVAHARAKLVVRRLTVILAAWLLPPE